MTCTSFYFFKELKKVYDRYHAQATGGGAYKFADDFLEKLGVCLGKLDEMDSVVSGANFLLQVSVSPWLLVISSYFTDKYPCMSCITINLLFLLFSFTMLDSQQITIYLFIYCDEEHLFSI